MVPLHPLCNSLDPHTETTLATFVGKVWSRDIAFASAVIDDAVISAIGLNSLTITEVYEDGKSLVTLNSDHISDFTPLIPYVIFVGYGLTWRYLLPLVTETTLLGEPKLLV